MEKNYAYLVIALLSLLFLKCNDDTKDDIIEATLSFSAEEVELASSENSSATIEVTSNQTKFTISVDESAKAWCNATISGKTITVKANSNNTETSTRTATVTVVAGEANNSVTKSFKVTQAAGGATLSFSVESVALASAANSTVVVEANTNQSSLQATVVAPADEWCSVSVTENVLLITALTENSAEEERTAIITVVAGSGANTITKELTVTQLATASNESMIGKVFEGGVVFWQDPDNPKRVKIVSATRLEGEPWCPESVADIPTGATSEEDGLANTNILKSLGNFDQYIAAKYCADMGEGWYFPSRREVQALFEAYNGTSWGEATNEVPANITAEEKSARAAFDAALTSLPNGVALNTAAETENGESIWSSTESDTAPANAWWVRFGKPAVSAGIKRSTTRTVRAIKIVTID
jgi:hypothetical protein